MRKLAPRHLGNVYVSPGVHSDAVWSVEAALFVSVAVAPNPGLHGALPVEYGNPRSDVCPKHIAAYSAVVLADIDQTA